MIAARRAFLLGALLASGCIPSEGPMMAPGQDCLECHGGGGRSGGAARDAVVVSAESGGEDDGPPWTVAGTVFGALDAPASAGVRGARIHLTEATGRTVTIHSNQAGNFYIADGLAFPLRVSVERNGVVRTMTGDVTYGGCNACHAIGGEAGGRLVAP